MVRDQSEEEPKEPFTILEVMALSEWLESLEKWRDLAMLVVGVESMLRACDLRKVRVRHVWDGHKFKDKFAIRQQKNRRKVYPKLPLESERFVKQWIEFSGKGSDEYLFTSFHPGYIGIPLTEDAIRKKVKSWAEWLGHDPALYGAHTLRRTKPIWLWDHVDRIDPEEISEMLGHKDVGVTRRYLGITRKKAQKTASKYSMFAKNAVRKKKAVPEVRISDQQLRKMAVYVAEELAKYNTD